MLQVHQLEHISRTHVGATPIRLLQYSFSDYVALLYLSRFHLLVICGITRLQTSCELQVVFW